MGGQQSKKLLFWIDADINSTENQHLYDSYLSVNFDTKRFTIVNNAIQELLRIKPFTSIIIIISGKLYKDFYSEIIKIKHKIKININVVVYLKKKHLFLQNLRILNLNQKNNFIFPRYIASTPIELEYYLKNKIDINEKELSFDNIDNYEELILPAYFSYFMKDTTSTELLYFNEYLKRIYSDNINITNLLNQFDNNQKISKEIIYQYWMHLYTLQTDFFPNLNRQLRNKNVEYYIPFIKLCYEMLRKGLLKPIINKKLYRGADIKKDEYETIIGFLDKKKNKEFPKLIQFSRCFLSFSQNEIVADYFLKKNMKKNNCEDNNIIHIFFILDEINEKHFDLNCLSNASIAEYSRYPIEEEVLFFPFSCFEVTEVKEKQNELGNYKEIYLKYLGKYCEDIKKQLGDKFMNKIKKSDFAEELIEFGLINYKSTLTWEIIEENKMEIKNICIYLENYNDFVGFEENLIKIISESQRKEKLVIKVHEDKIINVIKLDINKICSNSFDKTINIIELKNENKEYDIIQTIKLIESYAKKIIFLPNLDFILLKKNNIIDFYTNQNEKYIFNKFIKEERVIISIKELPNQQIIYFTNDNHVVFLDIMDYKKEIDLKNKINENLDMIPFENYLLIPGEYNIYVIDFISQNKEPLSFYLNYKLEKVINIYYDKFMISLYNEEKNESIIREFRIFIKCDKLNFDCIGEGFCEKAKIYNIVKISPSKIITKMDDNLFSTWIKLDEINEIYKPEFIDNNSKEIIENNDIENQNEEIFINNKNNNEISIDNGKNENKNINYEEMNIKEIDKCITDLNNNLKEKQEGLRIAIINSKKDEIENIKKSMRDIDSLKTKLYNIKNKKKIDELKRSLTFQKESIKINNQIPNINDSDLQSIFENEEEEKFNTKTSNKINTKKSEFN